MLAPSFNSMVGTWLTMLPPLGTLSEGERARWGPRANGERSGAVAEDVHRVGVRSDAGRLASVECVDRRHVRVGQLKVEHREVLLDAVARHGLREDDVTALKVPSQDD